MGTLVLFTIMILQSQKMPEPRRSSRHFSSSILLSCPVSWPCLLFGVSKFSGARNLIQDFFMIFAFVLFAARFFHSLIFFLFGKILFNVHEKAMRSDLVGAHENIRGWPQQKNFFISSLHKSWLNLSVVLLNGSIERLRLG